MPAAGNRWNDSLNNAGSWGNYWSRTLNSSRPDAYCLGFYSGGWSHWNHYLRLYGFSVRAVRVSRQNESLKLPKREDLPIDKAVLLDILNGKGSIESYTEAVDRLLRE